MKNTGEEKRAATISAEEEESFSTLQIGLGCFSEEAGGLNRFYCDLLQYLPRIGVEVQGLVVGTPGVVCASGRQLDAFSPASASLLSRLREARRAVRHALAKDRFPLVVSHFALYTFPALDLIPPRPMVIHFHGPWALEGNTEGGRGLNTRAKAALERAVYRRGNRFIVLSEAFRDILHRDYGVPLERVRVVAGGVNVGRFATKTTRREARERLGWRQDRPTILAVRRLAQRMGLKDLIEAMDKVRVSVPDAQLLVAGTGPLAKALNAHVRALGLEDSVRFLGFVSDEDLTLAYRAADLTVVPTVALEGFGLVAVESLAAGTPVLVTPVGGLPEVVRELSPDLVLPTTGADSLAEGLAASLEGELVLPSAQSCQAYARERFDWPVVASRVRGVYTEAIR